jgi:Phage major capsid protein E
MATPAPGMTFYDTATLVQVVPNLKIAQQFLLDRFFINTVTSDSEEVAIDVDVGLRRMAPFVSPLVEGKLVEQRRYQTNMFKPAYIKDKRAPDLRKPVRRMIGERIGGEFNGQEREMANLAAEVTDQIDILNRRLEWMAAQALMSGTVPIAGEGYPSVVVDFGRDPTLTVGLTGTAQWNAANIVTGLTASPTADIEDWQYQILKMSGARVSDIIFTPTPFKQFLSDPILKGAVFYPALNTFANAVNPGAQIDQGAVYKGQWGQYNLWVYNDWYIDGVTGVEMPMVPDGTVIMSGPMLQGTRAYGMIMDPAFNYAAMPYAPKTWLNEDPAQRYLMMQSAPIVIPSRVNASFCATVCPPVLGT